MLFYFFPSFLLLVCTMRHWTKIGPIARERLHPSQYPWHRTSNSSFCASPYLPSIVFKERASDLHSIASASRRARTRDSSAVRGAPSQGCTPEYRPPTQEGFRCHCRRRRHCIALRVVPMHRRAYRRLDRANFGWWAASTPGCSPRKVLNFGT